MDDVARSRNRLLERLAWGAFLIGLGLLYYTVDYYEFDLWASGLLLAGAILLIVNIARASWRIKVSTGSLGVGVIFLVVGAAMWQGIKLNWVAVVALVIGIWITLDALARRG